jgi:hypothetical protein
MSKYEPAKDEAEVLMYIHNSNGLWAPCLLLAQLSTR